ncbi:hypothetical protein D3C76_1271110 [compost metagenome]
MQVLPGLEVRGLDVEFLYIPGQAAIPAGGTRFDAKQQFALFVLECAATHGHADDQRGHAQQRQPAQAQTSEQGRGHRLVHRHGHEARVLTDARVEWGKMRRSLGRLLVGAGLLRA